MKITQREIELFEELRHWGTPLDPMVLRKVRAACRGLEITKSVNYWESIVYAQAAGGIGIMVSVDIENVSDRVIRIDAIGLRMPWFEGDFHWLKKLSSKEVRERGGYVLSPADRVGSTVLWSSTTVSVETLNFTHASGLMDSFLERALLRFQTIISTERKYPWN
jgi:hypothetical protein